MFIVKKFMYAKNAHSLSIISKYALVKCFFGFFICFFVTVQP